MSDTKASITCLTQILQSNVSTLWLHQMSDSNIFIHMSGTEASIKISNTKASIKCLALKLQPNVYNLGFNQMSDTKASIKCLTLRLQSNV